jgi:branched-chain amino acid transport system permease protein
MTENSISKRRSPLSSRGLTKLLIAVAVVVVAFLAPRILSGNTYWVTVMALAAINILLVSSLRSITLINEISLGQVGFVVIGAYVHATLMMKGHMNFWVSMIVSALVAAFIALILAYPFLKVKGIYFSILTLLTAETFRLVAYYWTKMTGGSLGLTGVPGPGKISVPGAGVVDFNKPMNFYYIAIGIVIIALLVLFYLERAYISFQWRAIKDDNMLAGAVGINVIGFKMVNFVIAAFMAGLSGAVFASFQHNLSPDTSSRFGVTMSIYLLVYMVVGGKDYFIGPLVGTAILTLLSEKTRFMQEYQPMIIGGIAIVVMIFMPMGLVGLPKQFLGWRKARRLRAVGAIAVPATAAAAPPGTSGDTSGEA